ncbi:MAG: GntR family transcriptional regulator [Actinomycetota bacterium]|nr:GntR family transcriptional regulator [Actinomycetota bacterium]
MTVPPTLVVTAADPIPPYEQLRRQPADFISSGAPPAGGRLPPLRQLAGDPGLAVDTVARAYRELEAAGLVRWPRGAEALPTCRVWSLACRGWTSPSEPPPGAASRAAAAHACTRRPISGLPDGGGRQAA